MRSVPLQKVMYLSVCTVSMYVALCLLSIQKLRMDHLMFYLPLIAKQKLRLDHNYYNKQFENLCFILNPPNNCTFVILT